MKETFHYSSIKGINIRMPPCNHISGWLSASHLIAVCYQIFFTRHRVPTTSCFHLCLFHLNTCFPYAQYDFFFKRISLHWMLIFTVLIFAICTVAICTALHCTSFCITGVARPAPESFTNCLQKVALYFLHISVCAWGRIEFLNMQNVYWTVMDRRVRK